VLSARLLLVLGDRLLLANHRGEEVFHLPGGNVEPGEGIEAALHRELREETGIVARSLDFVGIIEHIYAAGGKPWHEVNVVFASSVPRYAQIGSRADELDISLVSVSDLGALEFRPPMLGTFIQDWFENRRPQYRSSI
jgi:ADP-ribose pyrophosphatase YjhB (NUDIX family)